MRRLNLRKWSLKVKVPEELKTAFNWECWYAFISYIKLQTKFCYLHTGIILK